MGTIANAVRKYGDEWAILGDVPTPIGQYIKSRNQDAYIMRIYEYNRHSDLAALAQAHLAELVRRT